MESPTLEHVLIRYETSNPELYITINISTYPLVGATEHHT